MRWGGVPHRLAMDRWPAPGARGHRGRPAVCRGGGTPGPAAPVWAPAAGPGPGL